MKIIKAIKREWKEFVSARRRIKLLEKRIKYLSKANVVYIQTAHQSLHQCFDKIINSD